MRLFKASELNDRSGFPPQQQRIADVLHDWDPIGVFDEAVGSDDATEYDDLVAPLSVVLRRNPTVADLITELDEVMTEDYRMAGLDLREVAEQIVEAWSLPSHELLTELSRSKASHRNDQPGPVE